MDIFQNKTTAGNERAFRKGKVVPEGDINLAFARVPPLTPANNMVILDTSRILSENVHDTEAEKKLYFANSIGILEDEVGNQLVTDEYPFVTDIFRVDEDFRTLPGSEYMADDMLPFVHVSRYFHIDFLGQGQATMPTRVQNLNIRVVDASGRDYVDTNGNKLYIVKLVAAVFDRPSRSYEQSPYRVLAYVAENTRQDLYLSYNKIEIDCHLDLVNQDIHWQERLNPIPVFEYEPEESAVVDPATRDRKRYSSKPLSYKASTIGVPVSSADGYKVYVPRKAVADPRIFQLFRWRLSCTFTQPYEVDANVKPQVIRCGVVVTNNDLSASGADSRAAYALFNLQRSGFNATGVRFVNPVNEPSTETVQQGAAYWHVNLDTVTHADLARYDLLLWAPPTSQYDFTPYAAKIDYFTNTLGGTLFIDTNTFTYPVGLGLDFTAAVDPSNGSIRSAGTPSNRVSNNLSVVNRSSDLISGLLDLGGWDIVDGNSPLTITGGTTADPTVTDTSAKGTLTGVPIWNAAPGYWYQGSISNPTAVSKTEPTVGWKAALGFWYQGPNVNNPTVVSYTSPDTSIVLNRRTAVPGGQGDNEYNTLSYIQTMFTGSWYSQQINSLPAGWEWVWDSYTTVGATPSGPIKYLMIRRKTAGGGNVIVSSAGVLFTCSALFDFQSNTILSSNLDSQVFQDSQYRLHINSTIIEGAMKLLFNAALLAVKGRVFSDDALQDYSTSWQFSTPWKASWVINAANGVLSDSEQRRFDFALLPKDIQDPEPVWQRQLSDRTLKKLMDDNLTAEMARVTAGSVRRYVLEVTNSNVQVPTTLGDNSRPYAWTEVYSPAFTVPLDLGPHIIKEEEVKGAYEAGQFIYRSYPAKPYAGQVRVTNVTSMENIIPATVHWTATGTATETLTMSSYVPPSSTTKTSMIDLTYQDYGLGYSTGIFPPYTGVPKPFGIVMGQEFSYYRSFYGDIQNNWVHYGIYGQWAQGSSGEVVAYLQWGLNRIKFFNPGRFYYNYLAEDGYYGGETANSILTFQQIMGARYLDGVVDAETLSLIGCQLQGLGYLALLGTSTGNYTRFAIDAVRICNEANINDHNVWTPFGKRSWVRNGPSYIWDVFFILYNNIYDIHSVTVDPWVEGADNTMLMTSLDFSATSFYPLYNYNIANAVIQGAFRLAGGQTHSFPVGPYRANAIAIGLAQDRPEGSGSALQFGLNDIWPSAEVSTTSVVPGYWAVSKQTDTIPITASGTTSVSANRTVTLRITPAYGGKGTLSNIVWTGVTTDAPSVHATIDSTGLVTMDVDAVTSAINTGDPSQYTFGPLVPGGATFYSMDENRRLNPLAETGWVTKIDGIKLLCNQNLSPYGFVSTQGTSLFPTGVGPSEIERHYLKVTLIGYGNDPSVRIGFYDQAKQEFVTDAGGNPEMSYIEYLTRGPDNVYIGVISSYELDTQKPLPVSDDAPFLPYRWAMPVYGVLTRGQTRIGLEPVPQELGSEDIWPVAIRPGAFDRRLQLLAPTPISGVMGKYQNTTIHAFYGVPEARAAGWSALYGPPNVDVVGEEPFVLDDSVIQVRQPPFKLHRMPTVLNNLADPVRPIFTVYRRDHPTDSFAAVPLNDIADWQAATGQILLKTPLKANDPALVRVDYTTEQGSFFFKGLAGDLLNLNPYPGYSHNLVGVAVHIYIVPEYVQDQHGTIIPETVQTRTARYTLNPNIFDPLKPEYDPLAVQLGVVYVSPAVDVNELVLLDTRRRGGGAKNSQAVQDIVRLVQEASTYWDVSYGTGLSYQAGGFVIIRLPAILQNFLSEEDVTDVIDRNITAGVKYQVEYSQVL